MTENRDMIGYFKVVFKKTFVAYGDVEWIDEDLLQVTLNNGFKLVFNKNDMQLMESAERIYTEG